MLCSVVIPLYNKASYIEDALRSVTRQTYQRLEIIVVDDGSTDDGAVRVESYAKFDSRVRVVHQANGGVSRARNRGIEEALGDLVCFLDADDCYLPDYLETIVAMATWQSDVGIFATGYKRVSSALFGVTEWNTKPLATFELVPDFYARWRTSGAFFCTNSVALRRTLLAQLSPCFPVGESMGEDQDLWFRAAEISPLLYCPSPLVGYRVDVPGSLCNTNRVLTLLPVFERLEERTKRADFPEPIRQSARRLVNEAKISVARTNLAVGNRGSALISLLAAPSAAVSRRWWVTLALCVLGSSKLTRAWDAWRSHRFSKRKNARGN